MTDAGLPPDAETTGPGPWSVDDVAGTWAAAIRDTAYVPLAPDAITAFLRELTDLLAGELVAPAADLDAATRVGARLVARDFTGPHSLSNTVEVLTRMLPALATGDGDQSIGTDRVVRVLGAVVSGYTWAFRDRIFDQQQEVKEALLRARSDVERDLHASEARFREIFESSPVGIAISGTDRRIVRSNPALDTILGYARGELVGCPLDVLFAPDDLVMVAEHYDALLTSGNQSGFRSRFRMRRKDGEHSWAYLAVSVQLNDRREPEFYATMVEDINDLHLLEQRLNHQTLHDLQTGLPNRHYFITHLETVLGQLDPTAPVTLLHLDLDGFSAINDGFGLEYGDQLLNVVGARLTAVLGTRQGMVARLGCDEFGILVESPLTSHDAGQLAEQINLELAEPTYLGDVGVATTATIGVVHRAAGESDAPGLIRDVGATLRRMQGRVTRQWALYDPEIDGARRAELRRAAALPGALESGEVSISYQPVVTLKGRDLTAITAVLRWDHPTEGALTGADCLRVAELTGLSHSLGQWLLRTAAEQVLDWQDNADHPVPPLVIDLTPAQSSDPDLVHKIKAVLDDTGLAPSALELWLPAWSIRDTTGRLDGEAGGFAEDNVRTLGDLGVRIGLYDFAGGIGGLRCLADLPIRTVRVAEPVSRQVLEDPSRILSQSVHAITHILRGSGVNVVASPLETNEQADCWEWVGANWAIGSLITQPVPAQEIEHWLRPGQD